MCEVIREYLEINSKELDDNTLMLRVIAGETGEAAILYERYKRPLYAYFFKLTCGDNQSSEDLVHTVFYRAIRYSASFTGQGSFASWLFRIAHNAGIDHNRKTSRINSYDAESFAVPDNNSGSTDLEKKEQLVILGDAMRRLKPEEREVLVMGKIDCLKYRDIADILNTTENNVKIRIFRALKRLKEVYEKLENTGYEKARTNKRTD